MDRSDRNPAVTRSGYGRLKRVLDIAICFAALPLVLAVGLLCAITILIDSPGPVLFAQERTGYLGKRFRMYKFRTMVLNAEELKRSLAERSIVPPPDFKVLDDPRITRVGRFLRKTGLDELPQVINVLGGTMSFVGPRPTSFDASTYEPWHLGRLNAVPGITGLWQVEARNSATFDERVRYDLAYIDSMSLRADLWILARTLGAALRREGE